MSKKDFRNTSKDWKYSDGGNIKSEKTNKHRLKYRQALQSIRGNVNPEDVEDIDLGDDLEV